MSASILCRVGYTVATNSTRRFLCAVKLVNTLLCALSRSIPPKKRLWDVQSHKPILDKVLLSTRPVFFMLLEHYDPRPQPIVSLIRLCFGCRRGLVLVPLDSLPKHTWPNLPVLPRLRVQDKRAAANHFCHPSTSRRHKAFVI